MSAHRFLFYVPAAHAESTGVTLPPEEHHHAGRVLRLREGDDIFVTNGAGLILSCRVTRSDDGTTTAVVVETTANEPPAVRVTLALALIRKDRFEQAVEQCVELGVSRFVPFVASGCRVRKYGAGTVARLRKIALAAMKQSFRATLPEVAEPVAFDTLVAGLDGAIVVADPGGGPVQPRQTAVTMIVGPEAGLSDAELDRLRTAGAERVTLSRGRLRAETAAVALATALLLPR